MDKKLAVIMAGLPARGKSYLSLRLQRYLEWQGYRARIFNVGAYRRESLGPASSKSDFFDPRESAFSRERERIAKRCFADLAGWLESGGEVAIYDATNVTASRRAYLKDECERRGFAFVFVENICDDPGIIEKIIWIKIEHSADYTGFGRDAARADFTRRLGHYEGVYEPVSDVAHMKIINFGLSVVRAYGLGNPFLDEIADFLGAVNLMDKEVFLTRHGETYFNCEDRIGGDSPLTDKGVEYAGRLAEHFRGKDLVVFTSAKRRTIETASFFDCERVVLPELNEISSGLCDGLSYAEITSMHPEVSEARSDDKFNFRYPGGESYRDLIQRVKKAVIRIEAEKRDVLVIAHRAVNRCLVSYFIPTPPEEVPYIEMPLDRIIRIARLNAHYGCDWKVI